MPITRVGNQLMNSNGLPLDNRQEIEGSMKEHYSDISNAYEGLIVYSKTDKQYYKITNVVNKEIQENGYELFAPFIDLENNGDIYSSLPTIKANFVYNKHLVQGVTVYDVDHKILSEGSGYVHIFCVEHDLELDPSGKGTKYLLYDENLHYLNDIDVADGDEIPDIILKVFGFSNNNNDNNKEIIEFNNIANLPEIGEIGKLYLNTNENKIYRWNGISYIEIGSNLLDDFIKNIYIRYDDTAAYVRYTVDPMHSENDFELFRIEGVDVETDNIAGLMSPEDKRNLDTLSQKVEDLEQNQTTIDDIKEAMENLPDGSAVSAQVVLNTAEVGKMQILDNTDYDWAIGDANGNVLIACKKGHIFTEKFNSSVVNKTIVDLQKNNTSVADTIDFSEETDWISTARNYILKGNNSTLQISDDLGKTWISSTNPVSQIVFVHWFSNGTCLICSPTKAYYTTDYAHWIPSVIKDADGNSITISDSQWCFNMMNSYNSPVAMIGDKEFCMWGDYGHSSGYTARIWCSEDYGATVKCVLKNGYSQTTHADGDKTLNITHFHHCMWDNIHKCYWITTGDYTDKNQLIKGTYEGNAWKFETVLKGDNAKFIMVWADDTYLYALTDYTTGIQTGLLRCPLNRISDINNWKFIWSPENNECLGNMFADAEGNMVITGDDATWKKFWYAHGDVDFKAIENTSDIVSGDFCIHYLVGPNYNGDVIASLTTYGWGATKAQCGWNVSKRVLFSKAMRDAGAKNFGKQKMF